MVNTLVKPPADPAPPSSAPASDRQVGTDHNRPPLITNDQLYLDHQSMIARTVELETLAAAQPTHVADGDDATQYALQDLIKEIDKEAKIVETKREAEKAPFLEGSRIVDGFFKAVADTKGRQQGRLDKIRAALVRTATDYLRRKEAAARAILEAAAKARREEEERLRAAQQEEEERARKLYERNRPTAAAEKEVVANAIGRQADVAGAASIEAAQAANAKPAELARTRSDVGGALGTLTEFWEMEILEFDAIAAGPLWPYVTRAEKEKAIRAYMKANAPKEPTSTPWQPIAGVNFYRTSKGQFR